MNKLLLHTCCGVCSVHVLEQLSREFNTAVYFYNPNIQPWDEYKRRLEAVRWVCDGLRLPLVEGKYEPEKWLAFLKKECDFDFRHEPEGGRRCAVCFRMRLEETARFAKEHNFDWFATTLTMGRYKKAEAINPIGKRLAAKYGLKFYEVDWKKQNGAVIAQKLAKEKGIYRQNYCGCVFSSSSLSTP